MSWISVAWQWYSSEAKSATGAITHPHAEIANPIAAFLGAATLAWAAIQQARTATRRHHAQTEADRQRRITESYSKAVSQLASKNVAERLGGIYTLERISKESSGDYWTVMETLTAFVRDSARWKEPDDSASEEAARSHGVNSPKGHTEPPTDIAAALSVIARRDETNRLRREKGMLRLDLRRTDLRGALLAHGHLERVDLRGAHLEGANLLCAHFEKAWLEDAHLKGATLLGAILEGAFLNGAHLEGVDLGAHLKGAWLVEAHLQGADLRDAKGLTQKQVDAAFGDALTKLPEGLTRPAHWVGSGGGPNGAPAEPPGP